MGDAISVSAGYVDIQSVIQVFCGLFLSPSSSSSSYAYVGSAMAAGDATAAGSTFFQPRSFSPVFVTYSRWHAPDADYYSHLVRRAYNIRAMDAAKTKVPKENAPAPFFRSPRGLLKVVLFLLRWLPLEATHTHIHALLPTTNGDSRGREKNLFLCDGQLMSFIITRSMALVSLECCCSLLRFLSLLQASPAMCDGQQPQRCCCLR